MSAKQQLKHLSLRLTVRDVAEHVEDIVPRLVVVDVVVLVRRVQVGSQQSPESETAKSDSTQTGHHRSRRSQTTAHHRVARRSSPHQLSRN